jgi:hypothetical protein
MQNSAFQVADSKVHSVPVRKGTVVRWNVAVKHGQTIELSIYFRTADPKAATPEAVVVDVLHCEQAHHKVRYRTRVPPCLRRAG